MNIQDLVEQIKQLTERLDGLEFKVSSISYDLEGLVDKVNNIKDDAMWSKYD